MAKLFNTNSTSLVGNESDQKYRKAKTAELALEEIQTEKFANVARDYYSKRENNNEYLTYSHADILEKFYNDRSWRTNNTLAMGKDLANVIMLMIEKTDNGSVKNSYGFYHYSNEGITTWSGFATEIMKLGQTGCIIKPISTEDYPLPAPRPKDSSMSKEKIKNTFNLSIPKWQESLTDCMNLILK